MTDEQDELDHSLVKRKLTKRERFRGAVQRGVHKVKKSEDESTRDGEFRLNDDVKDFLAFRSPYSKAATQPVLQLPTSESQKTDPKTPTPPASTPNIEEPIHKTAPEDALPHFPTISREPLPVPRIDTAKSSRFPHARDLSSDRGNGEIMYTLRRQDGEQHLPTRKTRRKGLAVRFVDNPPIIIGEGGDEAEVPTMYLLQTRGRSRSDAPATVPVPERPQHLRQESPQQIARKPVASPARQKSPLRIPPQSQQSIEFDMTLSSGLSHKSIPAQRTTVGTSEPPPASSRRLRMRAEEGKTLRESFHESSFDSVPD